MPLTLKMSVLTGSWHRVLIYSPSFLSLFSSFFTQFLHTSIADISCTEKLFIIKIPLAV